MADVTSSPESHVPSLETPAGWMPDETFTKTVYYGTTRTDKCAGQEGNCRAGANRFDTSNDRTEGEIKYGQAMIKIPYIKQIGGIDGMSLEPTVRRMSWKEIGKKISPNDVLVFIHGFNTSFKEAAVRCGQLSFDLNFPGEALFFSWPSETKLEYRKDKRRADENISHLYDFLVRIAGNSDKKIHIVAHSMGTYILSNALIEIDLRMKKDNKFLRTRKAKNKHKIFNQVILVAGDIEKEDFADLFGKYEFDKLADGYTLYSTYNDIPLRASRDLNYIIEKNGQPRIGDSHDSLFTVKGMDTIHASEEVTNQVLGHTYYAHYSPLVADMYLLLRYNIRPDGRLLIQVTDKDKQKLWFIRPDHPQKNNSPEHRVNE
jgi:hypothetical protein